jgi:Outer membrane protein beta-barrel domain
MKTWLPALAVLVLSALASSEAQAQIHQGDFRLAFDMSMLSFTMGRIKADSPAGDYKAKDNSFALGPSSSPNSGLSIAYAASRRVIPGFYLGFQRVKSTGEQELGNTSTDRPEVTNSQLELRPFLELAFVPDSRFVPYGVLGFSYLRRATERKDNGQSRDTDSYGIGPMLGLGLHAFAGSVASIDLALCYRGLFIDDEDQEGALQGTGLRDIKQREHAVFLTLGASLWL